MSDKKEAQRFSSENHMRGIGILIALALLGVVAIYGFQRFVIMPSFVKLEHKEAEKDLARCLDAISREIHHLDEMCSDWSVWDDTYRFTQDKNESYLKTNIVWKTLEANSGINLIMFYKLGGEKIWGEALDSDKGGKIDVEEFRGESLGKGYYLLVHDSPESKAAGLMLTSHGPMLIVSRPVLTSDGKGPFNSVMLMGRFLDEQMLRVLADQTKVSFQVKDLRKSSVTPDDQRLLELLADQKFVLDASGKDILHGYAVVNDLEGKPALLITTTLPREILKTGQATAHAASLSVMAALALVALTVVLWFALRLTESRRRTARIERLVEERTAQLRESEHRYRLLVQSIPDTSLHLFDHAQRLLIAGGEDARMSNIDKASVEGCTITQAYPPDVAAQFGPVYAKALQGESISFEHVFGAFHYHQQVMPVYDSQGNIYAGMAISRNITARKRAEEEKTRLQDQLAQSQKMESVGRLAGGVAHDFNNMLGVILGQAEIAMTQIDPAHPVYAGLKEISMAAGRSADLTRQLLAFARRQTVSPKVLDLNETLDGMLQMLRRLIGEDIDLVWKAGAGVWPVKMDPTQIHQILANLCVNARDAIGDVGKVTIETGNRVFPEDCRDTCADALPGEYVMLAVSDTGCGMDKETMAHLFEPFFTTKVTGKGTGLGLATVYGAVTQVNGFINVFSETGQGTTFRIYLPRHAGKAAPAQTVDAASAARCGRETVLLVEDELGVLKMTTEMLGQQGYKVLAASTPGEAIRLAADCAGQIHLLITDVVMPEMNGRVLAKNLLSLYPHIKRLFMSGYTADVIAHHGVLDEGVHFIQKPFTRNDLAVKIREALEGE